MEWFGRIASHSKMNICQAVCQMVFNFNGIFFTTTKKIPWIWLVMLPNNFWEIISNAIHWNLRKLFSELSEILVEKLKRKYFNFILQTPLKINQMRNSSTPKPTCTSAWNMNKLYRKHIKNAHTQAAMNVKFWEMKTYDA